MLITLLPFFLLDFPIVTNWYTKNARGRIIGYHAKKTRRKTLENRKQGVMSPFSLYFTFDAILTVLVLVKKTGTPREEVALLLF